VSFAEQLTCRLASLRRVRREAGGIVHGLAAGAAEGARVAYLVAVSTRELRAAGARSLADVHAQLLDLSVKLEAATLRQADRVPDVAESSNVIAALQELRERTNLIAHDLRAVSLKSLAPFVGFLAVVRQSALAKIRDADNTDDFADAIYDAVDHLHDFVMAHDLVGPVYKLTKAGFWASSLGRKPVGAPAPLSWPKKAPGSASAGAIETREVLTA
jgi:hypothetical protein